MQYMQLTTVLFRKAHSVLGGREACLNIPYPRMILDRQYILRSQYLPLVLQHNWPTLAMGCNQRRGMLKNQIQRARILHQ